MRRAVVASMGDASERQKEQGCSASGSATCSQPMKRGVGAALQRVVAGLAEQRAVREQAVHSGDSKSVVESWWPSAAVKAVQRFVAASRASF